MLFSSSNCGFLTRTIYKGDVDCKLCVVIREKILSTSYTIRHKRTAVFKAIFYIKLQYGKTQFTKYSWMQTVNT